MIASLITDYERAVIDRLRNGSECTRIAVGKLLELPITAAGWRLAKRDVWKEAARNRERLTRYTEAGYKDEGRDYGTGKVRIIKLKRTYGPGG